MNWYQNQIKANQGVVPLHLRYATKLTREGQLDMTNRKQLQTPGRRMLWLKRKNGEGKSG
jgi:hypothetical protein